MRLKMSKKKKVNKLWRSIKKYFLQLLVVCILLFLQTFIEVKTETFVTKQDITTITDSIEAVEHRYNKKLANLNTKLDNENQIKIRQREVYTMMAKSLRAFVSDSSDEDKKERERQQFLIDYSTLWLWADDNTIVAFNNLIEFNVINRTTINENHKRYANAMLSMRKEIFPNTKLIIDDFKFLS